MPYAEDWTVIQSATKPERHVKLGVLHVHAVIDLDVVAIDKTGGRVEARRRNLFHQMGHTARAFEFSRHNIEHLEARLASDRPARGDVGR